jgi:hypothetical protein
MNSFWTGSTCLITTASALSPLIALLIGFAGTDRLLRWQARVSPGWRFGVGATMPRASEAETILAAVRGSDSTNAGLRGFQCLVARSRRS